MINKITYPVEVIAFLFTQIPLKTKKNLRKLNILLEFLTFNTFTY